MATFSYPYHRDPQTGLTSAVRPLRLWRIAGTSRAGRLFTLRVRAPDHDGAIRSTLAKMRRVGMTIASCVLVDE